MKVGLHPLLYFSYFVLALHWLYRTKKEGSSLDWECDMSEEEEDLILRMYKLIGNKWSLIAGRIPGRKAEEIERYWAMRTQQFCGSHGATIFASNKQMGNMISIPYHINGCNDVEVNS